MFGLFSILLLLIDKSILFSLFTIVLILSFGAPLIKFFCLILYTKYLLSLGILKYLYKYQLLLNFSLFLYFV